MKNSLSKITKSGILCALSIVLVALIHFPILPSAPFLEYDPADIPLIVIGFLYGPWYGLAATLIVSIIQGLTVSAASGWIGVVMHIIATGTLVAISGSLHKAKGRLALPLIIGSMGMILIMIPSNLFFTVKYWGTPFDAVVAMLPTAIIPFNSIKAILNSLIAGILYSRLRGTKIN